MDAVDYETCTTGEEIPLQSSIENEFAIVSPRAGVVMHVPVMAGQRSAPGERGTNGSLSPAGSSPREDHARTPPIFSCNADRVPSHCGHT